MYLMGQGLKLPMLNGMGRTDRIDNWWAQPAVMGIGLILAVLWTLWRVVFFSDHIDYDVNGAHVISPMFSPNVLEWDVFSGWDPNSLIESSRSDLMKHAHIGGPKNHETEEERRLNEKT